MKTAIIVGHSLKDKGAVNNDSGVSEFEYNSILAGYILARLGYEESEVVYRTEGYSKLPKKVNDTNADLAISLHCNAFNKLASGTETLSSGSVNSLKFANILHPKMVGLFGLSDRGIKIKKQSDRGGLILHKTEMPCVLLEPFFIDNDTDLEKGLNLMSEYAKIICEAIEEYENNLK